jgi:hypothetical protein
MSIAKEFQYAFFYVTSTILALATVGNLIIIYRRWEQNTYPKFIKQINWLILVFNIAVIAYQLTFSE